MSIIGRVLLLVYVIIVVLWLANSEYLFSFGGLTFWLFLILFGVLIHNQISKLFIKRLIKISNIVALTAAIYYITRSMP
ncbi:hypothetical protein [Fictibacillus phosphorivorans]|uniref:hypothetical protein n=1 Tax=Fictibacillus phosphorivorans TaxID=1221500 RepID=UPI00203C1DFB|nr:hypothetical protein [Fictibacillus phosphorivorans]MCM3718081.1 hypothetical protein [Fictibacillus phosphorivorans]MCM3775708.1 hypothetical protein [Fictibacillus phosphorivorans]